jgi:hypothetical protein
MDGVYRKKMKTIRVLNIILLCLAFVWTCVTLFIVYKNIQTPFLYKFIIGYVIFLLLYGLFLAVQLLLNLRNASRREIRKMLLTFLIRLVCLFGLQLLYYLLFKPTPVQNWNVGTSLGIATVAAFGDYMFTYRKKQK